MLGSKGSEDGTLPELLDAGCTVEAEVVGRRAESDIEGAAGGTASKFNKAVNGAVSKLHGAVIGGASKFHEAANGGTVPDPEEEPYRFVL